MDNPDANFIPANVTVLTRAVQFTALLSYCIFADESMRDIVKAVELFPQYRTAKVGDKTKYTTLACVLRYIHPGCDSC